MTQPLRGCPSTSTQVRSKRSPSPARPPAITVPAGRAETRPRTSSLPLTPTPALNTSTARGRRGASSRPSCAPGRRRNRPSTESRPSARARSVCGKARDRDDQRAVADDVAEDLARRRTADDGRCGRTRAASSPSGPGPSAIRRRRRRAPASAASPVATGSGTDQPRSRWWLRDVSSIVGCRKVLSIHRGGRLFGGGRAPAH